MWCGDRSEAAIQKSMSDDVDHCATCPFRCPRCTPPSNSNGSGGPPTAPESDETSQRNIDEAIERLPNRAPCTCGGYTYTEVDGTTSHLKPWRVRHCAAYDQLHQGEFALELRREQRLKAMVESVKAMAPHPAFEAEVKTMVARVLEEYKR